MTVLLTFAVVMGLMTPCCMCIRVGSCTPTTVGAVHMHVQERWQYQRSREAQGTITIQLGQSGDINSCHKKGPKSRESARGKKLYWSSTRAFRFKASPSSGASSSRS